jgi:hypothetical protein
MLPITKCKHNITIFQWVIYYLHQNLLRYLLLQSINEEYLDSNIVHINKVFLKIITQYVFESS